MVERRAEAVPCGGSHRCSVEERPSVGPGIVSGPGPVEMRIFDPEYYADNNGLTSRSGVSAPLYTLISLKEYLVEDFYGPSSPGQVKIALWDAEGSATRF